MSLALASSILAGCSSDGGGPGSNGPDRPPTTTTTTRPAPAGDAFYVPPEDLELEAGRLVWAAPVEGAPAGTKGWRILYGSQSVGGDPIAVSGLLFVPDPPPAPARRPMPVLALAHGTTGLGDKCAPSRVVAGGGPSEANSLPPEVLKDHVVVATDYEGLGTPGVHPYVVGLSSARSILDSIRVAQRFGGAGTTTSSPSVVWGHSQGGGAALVAAELATTYAADANVRGVAAGAPAAELKLLARGLRSSPFVGYLLMTAAGFKAAYPDLDLAAILTPAGEEAATRVAELCADEAVRSFTARDAGALVKADPAATAPFADRLEENSPGARRSKVPVFIYHGDADVLIPAVVSKLVLDRYCANGTTATRKTYAGESHGSVVAKAAPDVTRYLSDRLSGKPAPSSC